MALIDPHVYRFENQRMLRIGLTGGIGSGKSTVARMFEVLDIPVYNADQRAKGLMEKDPPLKIALLKHFGKEVFQDGHLNSQYLADRVFQNPEQLDLLNSLVHPVTLADARHWMSQQDKPFVLFEAALLFESGAQEFLDAYEGLVRVVSEGYVREGKRYATVAVGCTGGKHRSVAMAENLAAQLVMAGMETTVMHRDLGRE